MHSQDTKTKKDESPRAIRSFSFSFKWKFLHINEKTCHFQLLKIKEMKCNNPNFLFARLTGAMHSRSQFHCLNVRRLTSKERIVDVKSTCTARELECKKSHFKPQQKKPKRRRKIAYQWNNINYLLINFHSKANRRVYVPHVIIHLILHPWIVCTMTATELLMK